MERGASRLRTRFTGEKLLFLATSTVANLLSNLMQVYEWAAREETVESLSNVAVKSVLRGVWDTKYNRRFVKRIASVTLDEVWQ